MAVIREVKRGLRAGWQAIVRKQGNSLSRVLPSKKAALEWAGRVEAAIAVSGPDKPFDRTAWLPVLQARQGMAAPEVAVDPDELPEPSPRWTVRKAFEHYEGTVLPGMKGEVKALSRTGAWKERAIADKRLCDVTRADVRAVIKERLAVGKAANTVRNDLFTLSALFTEAQDEWELDIGNPVRPKDLPAPPPPRQARLQDARGKEKKGHEELLRDALAMGPDPREMDDLMTLALDTGMRRGEIVGICARDVLLEEGVDAVMARKTKNGIPRAVVLTARAAEILTRRCEGKEPEEPLFTLSGDGVQYRLELARVRAKLPHVRFHDLRHEALSRMADRGLTMGELQGQSGHRTAQVLLGYLNRRAADVKRKLG